jgi:hypothetical protein
MQPLTWCVLDQGATSRYFTRRSSTGEDRAHFSGIKRINLIVGPNNTGKSQLMRMLCRTLVGSGYLGGSSFGALKSIQTSGTAKNAAMDLALRMTPESLRAAEILRLEEGDEGEQALGFTELRGLFSKEGKLSWHTEVGGLVNNANLSGQLRQLPPRGFRPIYLPSLRTVRRADTNTDAGLDVEYGFSPPPEGVSNPRRTSQGLASVFAGQRLADEVRRHRLGKREQRKLVTDYESFVSERYFQGAPVDLVPLDGAEWKLHVRIGEEERPFDELGDGIQQLLVMTWPMFFHRDEDLVLCIDEPELCLHPGMQRQVLHSFLDREIVGNGTRTVFLATHSNHFIDAALELSPDDVSVFRVSKNLTSNPIKFELARVPTDDPVLLQSLGVRASSVLLANATIWVEGISDRIYLQHWLKLYFEHSGQRAFTEDLHFTFIEYAGANRLHYEFPDDLVEAFVEEPADARMKVERISRHWFLVADGDGVTSTSTDEKAKKVKRLQAAEVAKRPVFVTKSREMENLIAAPVLMDWMRAHWKEPTAGVLAFAEKDYATKYLGTFLTEQGTAAWKVAPKPVIAAESGTIKNKAEFAREICALTKKYEHLSEEAKGLVVRLAKFIEDANR